MEYAILGFIVLGTISMLVFYLRHDSKERGEAEESERQMKEFLDEVKKAKSARQSLINNPALRDELRRHHDKG